jgi:hypothetical protein
MHISPAGWAGRRRGVFLHRMMGKSHRRDKR